MAIKERRKPGSSVHIRISAISDALRAVLLYIVIWVIVPIIIGFLSMLGPLYMMRGGRAVTTPGIDFAEAQYDWSQRVWVLNTTATGPHILP